MSLTRQTQKVFGSNANANQLAAFGTMKTGEPVYSSNLSTLQTTAYTQGWSEAILNDKAPYMEEMNAVQYGLSYQIAYLLQEGVGAYDANTNYSDTSIVKAFENGHLYFYHSLVDNNLGHSLDNPDYWEKINVSDTRNVGEIVTSSIPLTDAGLHLLDGSLLSGSGSYSSFVDFIKDLYIATPTANYFCTEAQWQESVNTYGVCGKFVYDSINNTVRLPKYSSKIYTQAINSSAPVVGNGMTLGLTNGTTNFGLANCTSTVSAFAGAVASDYGVNVGTTSSGTWSNAAGATSLGVTTDGTKSGIIADLANITTSLDGYYYIVVATSTKTDVEVDIDQIASDLNNKADIDLSNAVPGESFIETAQSWLAPDYSRATSVSYTSGDTVGFDGWLAIDLHVFGLAVTGKILINNIVVCQNYRGNQDGGGESSAALVMVKATDIITYSNISFTGGGGSGATTLYKIPFVGGNA